MQDSSPTWLYPESLDEALTHRKRYGDDARLVAGGIWVTLLLQQGLIQPGLFLALHRIGELREIGKDDEGFLRFGAGVTLNTVARHPLVQERLPYLAQTYQVVANERIRNQGTVGGNLGEADYASDPPAMLVALDAQVRLARLGGTRELPVREFIVGHYETQIQPDEILVEVLVPPAPQRSAGHYLKYITRSSEDRPCVGVAAVVTLDEEQRCSRLAVVVGAVSGTLAAFPEVTAQARGERLTADLTREIAEQYAREIQPVDDLRGSAAYRRQLVRVLVPRAIQQALQTPDLLEGNVGRTAGGNA